MRRPSNREPEPKEARDVLGLRGLWFPSDVFVEFCKARVLSASADRDAGSRHLQQARTVFDLIGETPVFWARRSLASPVRKLVRPISDDDIGAGALERGHDFKNG